MIIDLHIHSKYSPDSGVEIRDIMRRAKELRLGGIGIMDHNTTRAVREMRNYEGRGLLLVPGIEISSSKGHILGLGLTTPVRADLSISETVERIRDAGGLPIAPHPYRRVTGIGERGVLEGGFRVIETFNARTRPKRNRKATLLAEEHGMSVTGGSDAHTLEEIGKGYTKVPDEVETVDDLVEAIRKGRSRSGGRPLPVSKFVEDTTDNVFNWMRRGLKKI